MGPQKMPRIVEDERFIAEAPTLGKILLFISNASRARPHFVAEMIEVLDSVHADIIFLNRYYHEELINLDSYFSGPSCSSFNHVARSDDDSIYAFCQDLSYNIMRTCDFSRFDDIAKDFAKVWESAALHASDDWSVFLRSFVMLNESIARKKIDTVVLLGKFHFCLCMAQCLESVGVNVIILRPDYIEQEKLDNIVRFNLENVHHKAMGKRRPNFDIRIMTDSISDNLFHADMACIIRIGDPVYAETMASLVKKCENLDFCILDGELNPESENIINSLFRGEKNFSISDIGRGLSCLSEKVGKFIAKRISDSMSAYDGVFFDFCGSKLHPAFIHYNSAGFLSSVIYSITYYRLFRRVLRRARPALGLMVSPGRRIESRVAVIAAREEGIASFELQCGTIARSRRFWPPNADYVLCNESESYRIYTDFLGVRPERVHLVGSPRLDHYTAPYRASRPARGGWPLRVFLALQPLRTEVTIGMVQVTGQACRELGDCELVVGFHPRETEANRVLVRAVLDTLAVSYKINEGSGLSGAARCDVCVTYFSTLGVEAFALGCHVIGLNVAGEEWPFRLSSLGIAAEASEAVELQALLRTIRDGKSIVEYDSVSEIDRRSREVLLDGKSAERIRNILQAERKLPVTLPVSVPQKRSLRERFSRFRVLTFRSRN